MNNQSQHNTAQGSNTASTQIKQSDEAAAVVKDANAEVENIDAALDAAAREEAERLDAERREAERIALERIEARQRERAEIRARCSCCC